MKTNWKLIGVLVLLTFALPACAGTFINGDFATGDFTGWTRGGGYWYGGWPLNPVSYLPGGSNYVGDVNGPFSPPWASAVVTGYWDPLTDNNLYSVLSGQTYSARINDSYNNYSVSVISQSVKNYTDPAIYFAWAAVLQGSHGLTDSDNFTLVLTDDTTLATVYSASYNSASAAGTSLFTLASSGWYYTKWQLETINVNGLQGHDFTLTLLGSDCPYGGHAGYVYMSGFGNVIPPGTTPEPGTLVLLGTGAIGLAGVVRRKLRL